MSKEVFGLKFGMKEVPNDSRSPFNTLAKHTLGYGAVVVGSMTAIAKGNVLMGSAIIACGVAIELLNGARISRKFPKPK